MKIFVAGASGAIGQPIITELIRRGHTVTGMTQSDEGARRLAALGASIAKADAFDASAVEAALRASGAEIVIDELTSLPKDPREMPSASPKDRKLRLEGGGNLLRAAETCGVRRYIQQSTGFFMKPASGLADESTPLAVDSSPNVSAAAKMYTQLEIRLLQSPMEGVLLRYGFFYGPNTWYHPDGGAANQVRQQQFPIVGDGSGVWSFVHIDDAALATVAALTAEPGIYNIVDDDPSPVSIWLPAFAKSVGAPPPPHITEEAARQLTGEDAVYYGTKLSGASNVKAKQQLHFQPRRLEWLIA
jgi:nucleoside-diphosphate-sugar epimerase